jgi:hypothetical protein
LQPEFRACDEDHVRFRGDQLIGASISLGNVVADLADVQHKVSAFVKAELAKLGKKDRITRCRNGKRKAWIDKADSPNLAVLRAGGDRPSNRAAKKGDEFPAPQMIGPHVPPRFEDRTASYPKWRIAVRGPVTDFAVHRESADNTAEKQLGRPFEPWAKRQSVESVPDTAFPSRRAECHDTYPTLVYLTDKARIKRL